MPYPSPDLYPSPSLLPGPAATSAGDPEAEYGWERVFGPDQPLTPGDVPVLQNAVCRVSWVADTGAFALERADTSAGDFTEIGRFAGWRHDSDGDETHYDSLISAAVVEWTPERAVVLARLGIDATDRCDLYLTLQRGWGGPRIECYAQQASAVLPGVAVRLLPFAAGESTLGRSGGTVAIADGSDYGPDPEPWAYLLGPAGSRAIHLALLQAEVEIFGRADSVAYGAAREGISVVAPDTAVAAGYLSVTFGQGPAWSAAADAEHLGATNLFDCRQAPALIPR